MRSVCVDAYWTNIGQKKEEAVYLGIGRNVIFIRSRLGRLFSAREKFGRLRLAIFVPHQHYSFSSIKKRIDNIFDYYLLHTILFLVLELVVRTSPTFTLYTLTINPSSSWTTSSIRLLLLLLPSLPCLSLDCPTNFFMKKSSRTPCPRVSRAWH